MKNFLHSVINKLGRRSDDTFFIIAGDSHCLAYDNLKLKSGCVIAHFKSAFCSSAEGLKGTNIAKVDGEGACVVNPLLTSTIQEVIGEITHEYPDIIQARRPFVYVTFGGVDTIGEIQDTDWQLFDVLIPEFPKLYFDSRKCFPLALFKENLRSKFRHVAQGLSLLNREIDGDLAVLSPPPPHRENRLLVEHLESRGIEMILPDAITRWKLAWLINKEIQRSCIEAGITYVDTWEDTSSDLFLKSCYELDGFHGNGDYAERCGTLLLKSMLEKVSAG